jgi:hypothetical protein
MHAGDAHVRRGGPLDEPAIRSREIGADLVAHDPEYIPGMYREIPARTASIACAANGAAGARADRGARAALLALSTWLCCTAPLQGLVPGALAALVLGNSLAPAPAAAATLRRGAFGEPESLAPRESGVASEQVVLRDLFEGLATFSAAGRVVPGAAESWQASADGLRYTFRLRPGPRGRRRQ